MTWPLRILDALYISSNCLIQLLIFNLKRTIQRIWSRQSCMEHQNLALLRCFVRVRFVWSFMLVHFDFFFTGFLHTGSYCRSWKWSSSDLIQQFVWTSLVSYYSLNCIICITKTCWRSVKTKCNHDQYYANSSLLKVWYWSVQNENFLWHRICWWLLLIGTLHEEQLLIQKQMLKWNNS